MGGLDPLIHPNSVSAGTGAAARAYSDAWRRVRRPTRSLWPGRGAACGLVSRSLEAADRRDLIRSSCRTLLVGAVAEQPQRFSRRFRRAIEREWPFSFGAMRRLRRRAERRLRDAAARLAERAGAPSLLDLDGGP